MAADGTCEWEPCNGGRGEDEDAGISVIANAPLSVPVHKVRPDLYKKCRWMRESRAMSKAKETRESLLGWKKLTAGFY